MELKNKVINAEVYNFPFNHIVIDNFLPNEIVNELLKKAKTNNLTRLASPGSKYSPHRYYNHTEYTLGIGNELSTKFSVDISNTIEVNFLHRDEPGYELWPHCDHMGKKISVLVYLDDFNFGTNLYIRNDGYQDTSGKRFDPSNYTKVKEIQAIKNRAFIFARTPDSWHGVSKTNENRYLWLITYQDKDWVSK